MASARDREKFHPRSPVQPDRSPIPYLVVAILAAILVWNVAQRLSESSRQNAGLQPSIAPPAAHRANSARGDMRQLFSADDYPAAAMQEGEQGTVRAQLTVDESGRVRHCTIVRTSGHRSLDEATCSILQRRARFTPARDARGRPVPDVVLTPPVTWQLAG